MKNIIVLLFLTCFASAYAQRVDFNQNWKFVQQDVVGAEQVNSADKQWRILDLPHDWSIEGEYNKDNPMGGQCGYLPAGIAWYRKTIKVPAKWIGKHVEIAFDGVSMNSTVWANGVKLGTRPYAWSSFSYDISELVSTTDKITFAVRVDNSKQPSARWYTGSGIYANTWINVQEKIYIPSNGIFVKTKGSKVFIETELKNEINRTSDFVLKSIVKDKNGNVVATVQNKIQLQAGAMQTIPQIITIEKPALWSPEKPYLYTLESHIVLAKKSVSKVDTRFGVRDIEWKPGTGMWLNGKNIKLQGVCNHQDAGALGAAVPDKILRFRIQQLKDMGCNTIRTAHNPQTPQFYDMCDEMGMMVMDELFDGWKKKAENDYGAHAFAEWWNRDLTDWLKRDRNHPSVVIYSLGNETEGAVAKELVKRSHEIDPTRPVTSGDSNSDDMDVLGVNGHSEKLGYFDHMPTDRVFIGTENTHTWQVRGFYRSKTWYRDGYPNQRQMPYWYPDLTKNEVFTNDWIASKDRPNRKQIFNSSYDNAMVRLNSRQNIEQLRDIPNYAGSFRWTGHDYIGEATYVHGGWPFKSFMGGAIDMANFEKDLYYLYQSQWSSKPMLHILPHWTHPNVKEGTEIPVWVYSNCDEVELFFNGTSLGKIKPGKKWDEMQCQWLVPYKVGELKAVGYKNGKSLLAETIRTADAPARIALSVDGLPLAKTGKDMVQVRVSTLDKKGEFYPYGENRTFFKVIGDGRIRALDNGSPIDVEKHYEATDRIAFYGLTRAYVETSSDKGDVALLAASILGEKRLQFSNKVSIDVQLLALRAKAPKAKFKIYYTLDGTTPTSQSLLYTQSFEVKLGTVVKALVMMNGKEALRLEEKFDKDQGFVWDGGEAQKSAAGEQAEFAKFEGAKIESQGSGFQGNGYITFGAEAQKYVQWYQENDGSEGMFNLALLYSADPKLRSEYKVLISINGKSNEVVLPASTSFRTTWNAYGFVAKLGSGANTIRVTPLDNDGLCIDELKVK